MRNFLWLAAVPVVMSGCVSYESAYERAVYDHEPVYCYQSLADVSCARQPYQRDERRLVSYYGPAPGKYDKPQPLQRATAAAPPRSKAYYRDPEPPPGPPSAQSAATATPVPPNLPATPAARSRDPVAPQPAPGEGRGPLHLGPAATAEPWPLP